MYTVPKIDDEIAAKVVWLEQNNGDVLHKDWLINAVMADHKDISGEDADFALCTARFTVQVRVERYFRDIKENETAEKPDAQLTLPGYERLQRRYLVERGAEQVAVSPWQMTEAEIDSKAEQLRSFARGMFDHANELLRFKEARRQKVGA